MKNRIGLQRIAGMAILLIGLAPALYPLRNKEDSYKDKEDIISNEKQNSSFDYNLEFTLFGGGMIGENNLNVTSPLAGLRMIATMEKQVSQNAHAELYYKGEGEKGFLGAQGTSYTLDSIKQYIRIGGDIEKRNWEYSLDVKYLWNYRPKWPDLYQPNPLNFGGAPDPNAQSYLPTDRNSYHRVQPEIGFTYTGASWLVGFTGSYIRNLEYIDPSFSSAVPIHLTPTIYHAGELEILGKWKKSDRFWLELKNTSEFRVYDIELSRDAVTGRTHYATTPNPNYKEFNNEFVVTPVFRNKAAGLRFYPFAAFLTNIDLFQGYYSYLGFETGFELKQRFHKWKYAFALSEEMQFFGKNGFDPVKTTDGTNLHKYYTKGSADVEFKLGERVEIFLEGKIFMKWTNYPAYVPGVNPGAKNYDIQFGFNNYSLVSGITYKLK